MVKKTFVLTFPQAVVQQPITYHLVKDYDWIVNILRARIDPDLGIEAEGLLVFEVAAEQKAIDDGLAYLSRLGLNCDPLAQDVTWDENRCTHCTACTSLCPTNALYVTRPDMRVSFDKEKCIACETCLKVCSYKAVSFRI